MKVYLISFSWVNWNTTFSAPFIVTLGPSNLRSGIEMWEGWFMATLSRSAHKNPCVILLAFHIVVTMDVVWKWKWHRGSADWAWINLWRRTTQEHHQPTPTRMWERKKCLLLYHSCHSLQDYLYYPDTTRKKLNQGVKTFFLVEFWCKGKR